MANELPDGTSSGYEGYCPKCNAIIETNIQGNEIGTHICKGNIVKRILTKTYNNGYNRCLEDLIEEDLLINKVMTLARFHKNE